ncbi:MAG: helix-turn-helix domain-containing protein, partial [Thioalkalivibrio sp.]
MLGLNCGRVLAPDASGNVRQLQNLLERAMLRPMTNSSPRNSSRILAEQSAVRLPDEPPGPVARSTSMPGQQEGPALAGIQTRSYQWVHNDDAQRIQEALKHTRGNQARAARL